MSETEIKGDPRRDWDRYKDLILFHPDPTVTDQRIQRIGDAKGRRVNLDYYSCNIEKMPPGMTAAGMAKAIRSGLNKFTGSLAEFTPRSDADATKWSSAEPVGAVIHIDMGVGWNNLEDGSVVCSGADDTSWTFSTVDIPGEDWEHPVSGHRKFGVEDRGDGQHTFFTMGADRATGWLDWLMDDLAFDKADELWREVMKNVCDWVKDEGGEATVGPGGSAQPRWKDVVREILDPEGGREVRRENRRLAKGERGESEFSATGARLGKEMAEQQARLANIRRQQRELEQMGRLNAENQRNLERINRENQLAQQRMRDLERMNETMRESQRRNEENTRQNTYQRERAIDHMNRVRENSERQQQETWRRGTVTGGPATVHWIPPHKCP